MGEHASGPPREAQAFGTLWLVLCIHYPPHNKNTAITISKNTKYQKVDRMSEILSELVRKLNSDQIDSVPTTLWPPSATSDRNTQCSIWEPIRNTRKSLRNQRSCTSINFAKVLVEEVFKKEERQNCNIHRDYGKGKLDLQHVKTVNDLVFRFFSVAPVNKIKDWKNCVTATDKFLKSEVLGFN